MIISLHLSYLSKCFHSAIVAVKTPTKYRDIWSFGFASNIVRGQGGSVAGITNKGMLLMKTPTTEKILWLISYLFFLYNSSFIFFLINGNSDVWNLFEI